MGTTGRARRRHLVVLLCIAIPFYAGTLNASTASAGLVENVTGQATEAVGGPVGEVVETVTSPVQEVTETATAPVQEVTEAPPVKEVTETATAPVESVAKEVTPPVKSAVESVSQPQAPPSSKSPGSSSGRISGAVNEAVSTVGSTAPKAKGTTRSPNEAVEGVTETAGATPKAARPSGSDAAGSPTGGDATSPSAKARTTSPKGAVFVPSPTETGATAAPLPKWVAYIWPAIALARPDLVRLLERSESALRLVVLGMSAGSGSVGEGGVAGVRASGGHSGLAEASSLSSDSDSPSSPLSKITTEVGHFPYNLSGAALGYIAIVAIMLIGLFIAVRWEIANGRREGRG